MLVAVFDNFPRMFVAVFDNFPRMSYCTRLYHPGRECIYQPKSPLGNLPYTVEIGLVY